jgi:glucose-6-phosphate-specific signal transduction histidine kinase
MLRRLRHAGPWFVGRPSVAVATAAVLFAATLALLAATGPDSDVSALLFSLPIALLAAAFGLRGGIGAGMVSVGLLVGWTAFDRGSLSAVGWVTRVVPLLLLGVLLGDALDRLRRAEAARIRLAEAERRHREAVQLNDTIVQSLSAAKWALESHDLDAGLEIVTETLARSQQLVSDLIRGAQLRPLWMGVSAPAPGHGGTLEGQQAVDLLDDRV